MSIISNFVNANQDSLAIVVVTISILIVYISKKKEAKNIYMTMLCCIYIFFVLYKTVFSRTPRNVGVIFELGWSYRALVEKKPGMFSQVFLNIMLYIPLGCFSGAAFCNEKKASWHIPLMLGMIVTLSTEFLQLFLQRGFFELDDIVNNMIGTVSGISVVAIINYCQRKRKK